MHETYDVFHVSRLCDSDVSVAKESNLVAFSLYDAMNEEAASDIFYKHDRALFDLAVSPWTQGNLIPHMHDERIHAISFGSYGYSLSFRNQFADFLHHNSLIFDYCTHTGQR